MPAVAGLRCDAGVAGLTQRHEVVGVTAAALRERKDMVYLLCRDNQSLLLTFLAERVRLDVAVTYTLPRTTVAFA